MVKMNEEQDEPGEWVVLDDVRKLPGMIERGEISAIKWPDFDRIIEDIKRLAKEHDEGQEPDS